MPSLAQRAAILGDWSPYRLPNIAARYSLDGAASDATYLLNSGNVALIADRSGNSAVNAFVTNVAASQTLTTPTKTVTGSQAITLRVALPDYTPASNVTLVSKLSGNDGFDILVLTTGVVRLRVGDGASITNVDSSVAFTMTDFATHTIGITWTDGVGASFTQDGVAVGTAVAAAKTLTNAAVSLTIGGAISTIYRVQIGSVYDANPSIWAKSLSNGATFVSGGDTYTLNSSGDLGARICGARDLVQLTASKQPAFSTSGGYNTATGDGSNDYMSAAVYSVAQPMSHYMVATPVSRGSGNYWVPIGIGVNVSGFGYDGSAKWYNYWGTASCIESSGTGTTGTRLAMAFTVNGAASRIYGGGSQLASGDAGSATINAALTVFGNGNSVAGSFYNVALNEYIIRSAFDDSSMVSKTNRFLARKWGATA